MSWRQIDERDGSRTFVLLGEPGDRVPEELVELARTESLSAAQLTAVGGFEHATVGWFDRNTKQYRPIEIDEQCEVLSLIGDVALGADGPVVHAHVVLGLADGQVRGGHLLAARVWPTLEVVLRDAPASLQKVDRPDLGLALIDLDRSQP